MLSKSFLIVFAALSALHLSNCELLTTTYNTTTYVNCSPEKASSEKTNECPKNSQCIDFKGYGNHTLTANSSNNVAVCVCRPEFMVNQKFITSDNSSVYCIERKDSHSNASSSSPTPTTQSTPSTKAPVSSTTSKPPQPAEKSTSTSSPPKAENSTEKSAPSNNPAISPAPEPKRSLFATLLVPVMIVLAFIGAIFAVRRFHVVDRAHTYIRNQRGQQHQTRYDGLENDFDDDPLLI